MKFKLAQVVHFLFFLNLYFTYENSMQVLSVIGDALAARR